MPSLRAQLEAASAEAGRTLSQEIEIRLRLSFEETQRAQEQFGGVTNYSIFQWIARGIALIERRTGHRWWADRFTFQECRALSDEVWGFFSRPGRRAVGPKALREQQLGKTVAMAVIAPLELVLRDGMELGGAAHSAAAPIVTKLRKSPLREVRKRALRLSQQLKREAEKDPSALAFPENREVKS